MTGAWALKAARADRLRSFLNVQSDSDFVLVDRLGTGVPS
jgi:hypothetical protein